MKSIFRLLFFLCVALHVPGSAQAIEVPEKYASGITIVHSDSMAPLAFTGYNGEAKGILIDFWRKWSEKIGVPVTFELMTWKDGLDYVRSGQGDVQAGLFRTDERERLFDFSEGFLPLKTGLIVLADSKITGMDSLGSSRVGVLRKGSSEEYIRKQYPRVEVVAYATVVDSAKALAERELDALYMDYPTVMYISGSMGMLNEFKPVEMVTEHWLCAGVAKGNSQLLTMVQEGLNAMSESEIQQIKDRWFVERTEESHTWVLLMGAIIIAFLGVLFFLFFGNPFRSAENAE